MALQECCQTEAGKSLQKHFDIAVCEDCGRLLLAYNDEAVYQLTVDELDDKGLQFETGRVSELFVVAKAR